jgi:DNA repair photolyase
MKKLSEAGVPVGIAIAPVIPTYNDSEIPALLERAYECGARSAFMQLLRLPTESLREYFISRLNENAPAKVDKILNQIRRERDGKLNSSVFGERMRGKTEQWKIAEQLFEVTFKRLGFTRAVREKPVVKEALPKQPALFQ